MARVLALPSPSLASPTTSTLTITGTGNSLVADTTTLVVDATNHRVGIGTAAPSSTLQVVDTVTDPASTRTAMNCNETATLSTNNAQVIRGYTSTIAVNQAGNNLTTTSGGVRGADFAANVTGSTGTVTWAIGCRSGASNTAAGTLTTGSAFVAAASNGAGTYGTFVGYDCPATTVGSTATYAFRGSLASAATRWNVYCDGTAQNYLAGSLGIGVTTPTNALSFGGNAARTLWMERHTTADTAGNSLTIQSGGATSGASDKAAGNLILATGLSTGVAVPANIRLQSSGKSTTGTSDQTQIDRAIVGAHKALADGSPTDLVSCTIASGSAIGGYIVYTIEVTDGTEYQSETGYVFYNAVNKAGTVTRTITEAADSQQAKSGGNLTTTWAISNASPAVISVNADTDLASPSSGYPRITFTVFNQGQQAIALA